MSEERSAVMKPGSAAGPSAAVICSTLPIHKPVEQSRPRQQPPFSLRFSRL
jgi:hypothetical protein